MYLIDIDVLNIVITYDVMSIGRSFRYEVWYLMTFVCNHKKSVNKDTKDHTKLRTWNMKNTYIWRKHKKIIWEWS